MQRLETAIEQGKTLSGSDGLLDRCIAEMEHLITTLTLNNEDQGE